MLWNIQDTPGIKQITHDYKVGTFPRVVETLWSWIPLSIFFFFTSFKKLLVVDRY